MIFQARQALFYRGNAMYCTGCGERIAEGADYCSNCGQAALTASHDATETEKPNEHGVVQSGYTNTGLPYAHAGRRLAAFVIDTILAALIAGAAGFVGALLLPSLFVGHHLLDQLFGILVSLFYFASTESSRWQATPGKWLMEIKVTSLAGERISFGHAIGRYIARLLCVVTAFIGYIAIVLSRRRKGFHDMAAGTLVVKAGATATDVADAGDASRRYVLAILLFLLSPFSWGLVAAIVLPQHLHLEHRTTRATI